MTQKVPAIYENKVFKPLKPVEGLDEHQKVEITVHSQPPKRPLSAMAGTISVEEAEELSRLIEDEFEHTDGEW